MAQIADNVFDAIIVDPQNRPVALVEVKSYPVTTWNTTLSKLLVAFAQPVEYVLAIDPVEIRLFRPEGSAVSEPMVRLNTWQVLEHYGPINGEKRVFEQYLLTLVEAWLRDLAYHWKSESPPGSEELRATGMLEKLAGCTTQPLGA